MDGADDSRAFKAFEAAGWSRNAVGYGALTGRITAHVADPLLDAARVADGTTVLDVGCGRGDLCAAAAARGARPTGVDLADGMVAAAREAHPGLAFRVGDAEELPFAPAAFDAVLAAFVVNHLPHPERAASEWRRVLAPGGRVAVAMWDQPERVAFLGLLDAAMDAAKVERGLLLPPGPAAYRFADDAELRALLTIAGFGEPTVRPLTWTHRIASIEAWWEGGLGSLVRASAAVVHQPPAVQARIRAAFERLAAEYRAEGGFVVPAAAKIAAGRR